MTGFLGRLFGGKKASEAGSGTVEGMVNDVLSGLIEVAGFDIKFEVHSEPGDDRGPVIRIELSGADEELIKDADGQVIDSIQLFLKRVVQHNFPEDRTSVVVDCGGFREESNQALVEMAEKLREDALAKGKSVYCKALPPRDRKVIHQHLAADERVRSVSVGDGLFKKIKIYPVKPNQQAPSEV